MSKKTEQRATDQLSDDLAVHPRIIRHCFSGQLSMPYDFSEGERTVQDFKDECDINEIMRRWEANQPIVHINTRTPQYGDFCDVGDYLEALNRVKAAQSAFAALPARIRDAVDNDPGKLLEFASDPANAEAWAKLHMETPLSPPPGGPAGGAVSGSEGASGQPSKPPAAPSAT